MRARESRAPEDPPERALPIDPEIPALRAFRERGLSAVLAAVPFSGPVTDVALLRHNPGRRCTVLIQAGRDRVVLKAYTRDPSREIELLELLRAAGLASGQPPTVAPLLAFDRTARFLVLEWLDGPTCRELLRQAAGARAGELAATWLRATARASFPAEHYGPQELLEDAGRWVRGIAEADPELGVEAAARVGALARSRPLEGTPVLQHGSLSVNHVFDLGSGPGVIDVDGLSRGPMELDAGRFLGTVSRGVSEQTELAPEAERAMDALRTGLAGLVDERALAWYHAAALVKDAKMLCTRQPPRWRERAGWLLAGAGGLLAAGS
jgi:hypothetical protein